MILSRTLARALILVACSLLGACGDNEKLGQATVYEKGKYQGKPDTRPYENGPNVYSNGSTWNAGDRTGWENAVKNRQQRQNEYNRAE